MSLRHTLRKAAELLVELPPEEPEPTRQSSASASTADAAGAAADKIWADLERQAKPAGPTKTVEQIVQESPGPNLDQVRVSADPAPQVVSPDGSVNFQAIYQSANLPATPFTAEQVLEMMAALPADVPLETRRQMIKVSIGAMGKAIGATAENIVADASRKLAALAAHTDNLTHLTDQYCSSAESKIAELQAEIENTRKSMETARAKQQREVDACTAESHSLDDVLEFFSLDVPPSRHAPGPEAGKPPE